METKQSDVITVTDLAATNARRLAAKEERPDAMLRIRVTAGGCAGFSYKLSFEDSADPDDHIVVARDGFRVLVDPKSAPIVLGSTLDFDTSLVGGGLKMHNPQAVHGCACGDSFSI
jgi:iron-sulfur cluster assembly accessory protein